METRTKIYQQKTDELRKLVAELHEEVKGKTYRSRNIGNVCGTVTSVYSINDVVKIDTKNSSPERHFVLSEFLVGHSLNIENDFQKTRIESLHARIRQLAEVCRKLANPEEYQKIRDEFVSHLEEMDEQVCSTGWRKDGKTREEFTAGSIQILEWLALDSKRDIFSNRDVEDVKISTNRFGDMPFHTLAYKNTEIATNLHNALYTRYSAVFDGYMTGIRCLRNSPPSEMKMSEIVAQAVPAIALNQSTVPQKKEDSKMANENSKSAATSTRRENGLDAKSQASSFGKLIGAAASMAAVDQTGEVFLKMSEKVLGNNPTFQLLMDSPEGREAMKLVTATIVRTVLLSAPEAVKGSDGIVACADLQVTFSAAKLMTGIMKEMGDQLSTLASLGGELTKE